MVKKAFLILKAFCIFSFLPIFADYWFSEQTPILKALKSIELTEKESGLDGIDCIYAINLDIRAKKWERAKPLFDERGLKVNRVSAINGWELPVAFVKALFGPYPIRLNGGQIGCALSHLSTIKDAYERGFNLIWILEDDMEFIEDVKQIPSFLNQLSIIDPTWDMFYTDTNSHWSSNIIPRPGQPYFDKNYYLTHALINADIKRVSYRYSLCSYLLSRNGMKKILDYYWHVYFWSPIDIDIHFIPDFKEYSATRDIVSAWREAKISDTCRRPYVPHSY